MAVSKLRLDRAEPIELWFGPTADGPIVLNLFLRGPENASTGLTSREARALAKLLIEAADRLDDATHNEPTPHVTKWAVILAKGKRSMIVCETHLPKARMQDGDTMSIAQPNDDCAFCC